MAIFGEKCIYMKKALVWAALLLSMTGQAQDRMDWFRDAKFGMFIHWGIYTELAGMYGDKTDGGEWMMHSKQIPISEYSALAGQFNPVRFDADDWMSLAAEAGQRYLVVTAKHHDGFAMYGSKVSGYNIVDATPYGRDVLQELHDACLRHGIHFGFYYSHMLDWYHPGANGCAWDPAHKGSRQDYLDKVAVPQVRELLDRFPDAEIVWFDQGGDITEEEAMRFYGMVRENPSIILNNRIGGGLTGDVITPEQFIPATGYNGKPWETCMTMNRHWAYCAYDDNWKSAGEIILKLSEIVSKGGNLLLNIGPDKYGTIPQICRDNLKAIGRWMKVNGEAIYSTEASPFPFLPFGYATRKGNTLYLHIRDWSTGGGAGGAGTRAARPVRRAADDGGREGRERTQRRGLQVHLDRRGTGPQDGGDRTSRSAVHPVRRRGGALAGLGEPAPALRHPGAGRRRMEDPRRSGR